MGDEELTLAAVAKMFGETEEEFQRSLEEAHAQIEAGEGVDVTEELLEWERRRMELSTFMLDVLHLFSPDGTDCSRSLFWRCEKPGTIEFFVIVNDLFWWATADLEPITPEDLPALRQALADVKAIDPRDRCTGLGVWAARKRGMRPQQPAYPKDKKLRALFDACGPVRTPAEEG